MKSGFKTIRTKDRHWRLMNLGHAFLESALTLTTALPKVEERRHGGICLLTPIVRELYEGLEHFLLGACACLAAKADGRGTPKKLCAVYEKALKKDAPDLHFDSSCVTQVYLWNHWVATMIRAGEAATQDQTKNWQTDYRGQAMSEKTLHDLAVRCRDECARVHILLFQRMHKEYKLELGVPWWEPDELVQEHVQAMIRHLDELRSAE